MKFGVFDHLDRGNVPLARHYENRLRLAEVYDREGFHAYHIAEHHSTPLGTASSPSVFLYFLLQRTKRLRIQHETALDELAAKRQRLDHELPREWRINGQ